MDSAIHTSAAAQRRVGGIDNGIDIEAGDIALVHGNSRSG